MYFAVFKKRSLIIFLILLVATVFTLICIFSPSTGQAFLRTQKKLPIYRVKTDQKKIAISFDCAWGVDYTDKLLSIMQDEDVRCTFFMVEFWTEKYPEYVKKISDFGHEIGTHSSTHPKMSQLDKNAILKELNTSKNAIEEITGKRVELFRPPFGDYGDLLIETAEELGLFTIQWDVDSLDLKDLSATEITRRVTSKVKSGSIVLFHNQGLHTAEALTGIIKTLKSEGYTFVPIGELIYRENYKIATNGEQILNS